MKYARLFRPIPKIVEIARYRIDTQHPTDAREFPMPYGGSSRSYFAQKIRRNRETIAKNA
jgi:hypothetical protein